MAAKKLGRSLFTSASVEKISVSIQSRNPKHDFVRRFSTALIVEEKKCSVSSMNLNQTPSYSPKNFNLHQIRSYSTKSNNFHQKRSYSADILTADLSTALFHLYDLISANIDVTSVKNLNLFENAEKMLNELAVHITVLFKGAIKKKFDMLTEESASKLFDLCVEKGWEKLLAITGLKERFKNKNSNNGEEVRTAKAGETYFYFGDVHGTVNITVGKGDVVVSKN